MTMKLICCLLAVGLFGYLTDAQQNPEIKYPQVHQYRPASPQNVVKIPTPPRPQNPIQPKKPTRPQEPAPPQTGQRPSKIQKPSNPYPQSPTQVQPPQKQQPPAVPQVTESFHTCEVPENYKIQCGPPGISASECGALSCCFDGRTCFYGKYVTLQCTKDGQFIVVVARDATLPNIDLESISFLESGSGCGPVGITSAFAIYQFSVTECGTTMSEEPGIIVYQNKLTSSYGVLSGPNGVITRDTYFDLTVQCRYTGALVEALVVEISTIPAPQPVAVAGPLNVELRLGSGQCTLKGCVEADVAYSSFYTQSEYPIRKVLRDPVYVDVYLAERTDPNLVLTLGRCWATADSNAYSLPQWDLLVDGCPYFDDRYQTTLVPVGASSGYEFPSHHRHFVFKMFTFVSLGSGSSNPGKKATSANPEGAIALNEHIYIHCETSVCLRSAANNREPRCYRKRREIAGSLKKAYRHETTVASSGLIVISGEDAA
uniref:Zona pellucida sperm-binding protein 4 n=1 Tax=Rhabdoblennius nitidus TaxID=879521 RepID=A0A6F8NZP9_9TELE|nr:choriogenin H minor [Rhabdoblennius nitidus]